MEEYLEQYNRLLNEENDILKTLKELENNETVKKYKELFNRSIELKYKEEIIYEKMIIDKISKCSHFFIPCGDFYYCIKCGLNTSLKNKNNIKNKDDMIIHNYLCSHEVNEKKKLLTKKEN